MRCRGVAGTATNLTGVNICLTRSAKNDDERSQGQTFFVDPDGDDSSWSDDCPEGEIPTCWGYCVSDSYEFWLGDGECDYWFECAETEWDGGDCL